MRLKQAASHYLFLMVYLLFSSVTFAEPQNLALLYNDVKQYHDSGEYQKELKQTISQAQRYLLTRIKANQQSTMPKKLALVLDIDETSLTNYSKMVKRHFIANKAVLHQDILKANSPAIESTHKLYQEARKHGVAVFFITGRKASPSVRQATIKNLKKAGYAHWTGLFFKPPDYDHKSIIPFKSKMRELITQKGYTIIASIGDQNSDLIGGFAEKKFKLPNPYYYLP